MRLTKVAKRINRLKGEIADLSSRATNCVSCLCENEFDENLQEVLDFREKKVERLVALKAARMKANVDNGMYEKILLMGELKAEIETYASIHIKTGKREGRGFGESDLRDWKAQLTKSQKRAKVVELQAQIDDISDELDEFNASTSVEL